MTELNAVASVLVGSTPADAVYLGSNQVWTAVVPAVVTGGQAAIDSGFVYHVFTSSGTLTIADAPVEDPEVFVVAGGGGGGRSGSNGAGGGGGAGGLLYYSPSSLSEGTYSIIVGGGGAGTSSGFSNGVSGSNSSFAAQTAIGGGGGGSGTSGAAPLDGGSGGGGGTGTGPNTYQAQGVPGQGNAGGLGATVGQRIGGGGGGFASAGENATDPQVIPAGGSGFAILGTTYAQGGQGSSRAIAVAGSAGQVNTGFGGDGGPRTINGAAGGSGAVIVRYQSAGATVSVPDAITDLNFTIQSDPYVFTMSWTSPPSNGSLIGRYVIETSSNGGETWSAFVPSHPMTTYVTSDPAEVPYGQQVRVMSENSAGLSQPSNVVTIPAASVPDAIDDLTSTVISSPYLVSFAWTTPSTSAPITNYVVDISYDAGLNWTTLDSAVTSTSYTVPAADFQPQSLVRVSSVNFVGQSQPSNVVTLPATEFVFIDYALVAGGGGGGGFALDGSNIIGGGGGGGAGGFISSTMPVGLGQAVSLTIGTGGSPGSGNSPGSPGTNSVFGFMVLVGGGHGGMSINNYSYSLHYDDVNGGDGGSGGGGGSGWQVSPGGYGGSRLTVYDTTLFMLATGLNFQYTGNGGRDSGAINTMAGVKSDIIPFGGGGGGVGGQVAYPTLVQFGSGTTVAQAVPGGPGVTIQDFGTPVTLAAGGGGGGASRSGSYSTPGAGGSGIGGSGGSHNGGNGGNAAPSTGSGGGGAGGGGTGGAGSSGICLLKVPLGVSAQFSAGVSYTTESITGYTVYKVTSAGASSTVTFA